MKKLALFLSLVWARFMEPLRRGRAMRLGVPYVAGGSIDASVDKVIGLVGVVIGLLITIYVLAEALPLGITALIAVDTGSTLFNTFMNTIFPLLVAAFAIFVGLRFLKMTGE